MVPPAPVVLDLAGVTFFGSAGRRVLLDHSDGCAALGSRLEVIGGPVVARAVAVTGLTEILTIVPPDTGDDHRVPRG